MAVRLMYAALATLLCYSCSLVAAQEPFELWVDPPGSQAYKNRNPQWYDLIETRAGQGFNTPDPATGEELHVEVNMGQHGAIHRFADPSFLASFDQKIRDFNGPLASNLTGTLDRCGWPNLTASAAPESIQYRRRTTPMTEDFSNGFTPDTFYVALVKGCCKRSPLGKYAINLNMATDSVNGEKKNVLQLTSVSIDDPQNCPQGKTSDTCHKIIDSSGSIATSDLYASGRYEVIAKVPAATGLIWAIWIFHFEGHLPDNCENYSCYCDQIPTANRVPDQCSGGPAGCKFPNVCDGNTDGWKPKVPPPAPLLSPAECGAMHSEPDPQFLGDDSFSGWATQVNHEIDIEIPANCEGTPNVCNVPSWVKGSETCSQQYHTTNLNNYMWTQSSGTGPAYSNMCVNVTDQAGKPVQLIGDDKWHNYTFNWHTGDEQGNNKRVDFYIDGVYLGTNNVMVPTRAARLYIAHWGEQSKNRLWNYWPDNWGGGKPGDGESYTQSAYISSVSITPFNEPGDIMAASTTDKPDGCQPNYHTKYPGVCHPRWDKYTIPPVGTKMP